MKIGIAAFCKTIGNSEVKTRLAKEIGQAAAEEFYRLSVACTNELLKLVSDECVTCFWAVGEAEEVRNPCWSSQKALWAGSGSLGEKMWHVTELLLQENEAAVIIGTDSPQMTVANITEALQMLEEKKQVLGPSEDGGFYLYGSCVSVAKDIWIGVKYSQDNTALQFKKALKMQGMVPYEIDPLRDVDEKKDLPAILKELEKLGTQRTAQQEQLRIWITDNWG